MEDQLFSQEGLGHAVRRCLGLFYNNNGMVVSRYTEWFKGALNMLIFLFRWYKLVVSIANSKAMECQLVILRSRISEEAVKIWYTDRGETHLERMRRWIPSLNCRVEPTPGLMTAQIWRMHGAEPGIDWNWLPVSNMEHILQFFDTSFMKSKY